MFPIIYSFRFWLWSMLELTALYCYMLQFSYIFSVESFHLKRTLTRKSSMIFVASEYWQTENTEKASEITIRSLYSRFLQTANFRFCKTAWEEKQRLDENFSEYARKTTKMVIKSDVAQIQFHMSQQLFAWILPCLNRQLFEKEDYGKKTVEVFVL